MRKLLFLVVFPVFLFSCANVKQSAEHSHVPKLKLLNTIEVPFDAQFQNTKIGGLSGIDFDPKKELYYIISDDRSIFNEARYYTATIALENNLLKNVIFQSMSTLKNETGKVYGSWNTAPNTSTDPEDIRFNPKTNTLVWSSEGARVITADKEILQNPALNFMTTKGDFLGNVTFPENLKMQKIEKGPRNNGTLEGITFDKNFKNIYTNIEEPLFEDGNQATTSKGGLIRLYQFNAKTGKNTAQYGYLLDPIAREPNPSGAFAVNGISAIQYYSKNKLFVVERSYSTGTQECTVKVFLCDLKKATNVKNNTSLLNQNIQLGSKKLVLNMDDLGIFIDNIEGITFGPKLANGNRSLVLVSDNNFAEKQKTQFFLFEVME
ncbi:esterase-like activity of phytase family protein [Flavobacterium sp. FPG59]|uniref:esterase-like activity of phytase family protein n=1 Tax=Flavobacterium sp. FPG59 TaxID=1929267 RepID=UPI000A38710B|nr:esterase-like activity of phytase family protein [Flavobacterium sp. FPG59]OUD35987.1 hypothetical protein FPG59_08245 [Flavobacterium sp. FPG59]